MEGIVSGNYCYAVRCVSGRIFFCRIKATQPTNKHQQPIMGTRELSRRYFRAIDEDKSGVVDEDEMLQFYGVLYGEDQVKKTKYAFKIFRGERDVVARDELVATLTAKQKTSFRQDKGVSASESVEWQLELFSRVEVDKDKDGALSFDEFMDAIKNHSEFGQPCFSLRIC
ncbi:calcineurin regulatory subunit (predicted) [Planoprotostelium fungivorum]|uniref:Calcineurin regulatory subunit (Predicted) n=1 Tax=Planoprotostelium fungivorum TaxID=1890364 RepID=A0A2P6MP84_9EUKA|nr:calcineurin regulatory subunit (predicted) [Planoprotostelium fungivorum]